MPLIVGTRLGPYEIQSALGAGGMGEVYKARDTRLDRTIAIKVLAAHLAGDPAFRERFEREARVISQLDHPHICAFWLLELGRGILSRFTFDAAVASYPIWSPDGSRIVFQTNRQGNVDLYQKPANNAGSEEPLLANSQSKLPYDWSADGRFLLYRSIDPKSGYDLWALPMDGDRKPFPVTQTEFTERDGQFSPDGKWIAYQSDESGRFEIYVQPFPGPGTKTQVSANGGAQARWRGDGKELFYIALDERLMAVPIRMASDGKATDAGAPIPLFVTHVGGAVQGFFRPWYMVSSDGQRFLMSTITEEAASPITVLLNWKAKP